MAKLKIVLIILAILLIWAAHYLLNKNRTASISAAILSAIVFLIGIQLRS